jgi:predicted MPP superfamily phosphohydrolase
MRLFSAGTRRRRVEIALAAVLLTCALCTAYAALVEPTWIRILNLSMSDSPSLTLVHLSDLHYKGDQKYLDKVVRLVNEAEPDFVCITGDLVGNARFLPPVLAALEKIQAPVYAVPGNHEHWARVDLSLIDESCKKTEGGLLVNSSSKFGGDWFLVGIDDLLAGHAVIKKAFADVTIGDGGAIQDNTQGANESAKKSPTRTLYERVIFLTHCPLGVELLEERKVALALAGHSHGGRVRLPIMNALYAPQDIGRYDRGYYETPNGPLYVNPGIGTWLFPLRFLCRPEITVVTL